jgi:GMP synthase-like glutamine amidotransferase
MYIIIVNYKDPDADYGNFRFIEATDLSAHMVEVTALLRAPTTEGLVISGGPQFVTEIDNYPELYLELELIHVAAAAGKLILGICLGFQLINHAFGNSVVRLEEPRIGCDYFDPATIDTVGDYRLQQIDFSVFSAAFSFHSDGVEINTSPDLITVASSRCDPPLVYAVRHRSLPIYGFQIHPEATVEGIQGCLVRYGEELLRPLAPPDAIDAVRRTFFAVFLGDSF